VVEPTQWQSERIARPGDENTVPKRLMVRPMGVYVDDEKTSWKYAKSARDVARRETLTAASGRNIFWTWILRHWFMHEARQRICT
jgi:hypothetical protein